MRAPNPAYTWVNADHGVLVHREGWVGSRVRGTGVLGWAARTRCGIEFSSATGRQRSTRIPINLQPCPECLPGLAR